MHVKRPKRGLDHGSCFVPVMTPTKIISGNSSLCIRGPTISRTRYSSQPPAKLGKLYVAFNFGSCWEFGCSCKLGSFLAGVLIIRALLLGAYISLIFGNSHKPEYDLMQGLELPGYGLARDFRRAHSSSKPSSNSVGAEVLGTVEQALRFWL